MGQGRQDQGECRPWAAWISTGLASSIRSEKAALRPRISTTTRDRFAALSSTCLFGLISVLANSAISQRLI